VGAASCRDIRVFRIGFYSATTAGGQVRHKDWRTIGRYNNYQKYVPIDLANFLKVIASEAKQSDAEHRPEQSRGIPRNNRDDPL
jgi:hypothetical protein